MSLPTPPPQLIHPAVGLAPPHIQIPLSRTYSFPLTPSPNSPFRAHRTKRQQQPGTSASASRPKPYHRPQSEFQCHAAGPVVIGTADSNITSSSTSSSHPSSSASPYHHHPHLTSASSRSKSGKHHPHHHQQHDAHTAALAKSQSVLDGDAQQKLWLQQPTPGIEEDFTSSRSLAVWYQEIIKTEPMPMDTAPAFLPYSLTSSQYRHQSDGLQASPQALTVPIFAPVPENQAPPPPLVFPTEYIEEHVAKYLGNDAASASAPIGQCQAPARFESFNWLPPSSACSTSSQSSISRQSTLIESSAFSDCFSSYLPTPASSFGTFPYVSTYVPASTSSSNFNQQCPYRSNSVASTVIGSDNGYGMEVKDRSMSCGQQQPQPQWRPVNQQHQKPLRTVQERMAEEKRKQRYAMELIETAITSIHKIWPETREPDSMYIVNPVTRNGELRTSTSPQQPLSTSSAAFTSKFAYLRRDKQQQQLTPDSSPTFDVSAGARKRKHGEIAVKEEAVEDLLHALKKRSVGEGLETRTVVTIPVCTAEVNSTPVPSQAQHHNSPITLRLFVRELLRRSKTSCSTLEVALCYLDGIEDTVKKLKDCVKLGIAFGTAAMAERGPYDEGMKDEGRIIKLDEFMRMQSEEAAASAADAMMMLDQEDWTPISPESDASGESKPVFVNTVGGSCAKTSKTLQPSSQVLSTHPLLDARRTFLAALVLATKFIQDKAYSNKAWAKLSGLAGREVGRCERALGGALGWRLWVGKDYDGTSVRGHSRPTTPTAGEPVPSTLDSDGDSVVHGENDMVAKAFMAEAMVAGEMAAKARAILSVSSASNSTEAMVIPAPVLLAPAQAANMAATRAGCGRARTWPLLAVDTSMLNDTNANLGTSVPGPTSAPLASTFTHLSENFAAVHLQSAVSAPLESHSSWLDRFLEYQGSQQQQVNAYGGQQPSTGIVPHNANANANSNVFVPSILHHSPFPLENPDSHIEDDNSGIKTEPATPATVRITVDDVEVTAPGERTPLATPYLAMAGSFSFSDPSTPPTGFIEPWQSIATYPFTFNLASQQQQWPPTAHPTQQQRPSLSQLLHPQTAALRGYGNGNCGGNYSSPTSVSTLSSPEVLTPVHSRAPTLVDGMEYARSLLRPLAKSVSMPMPVSAHVYQGMDLSTALLNGYPGHV
ncbi:hypothetical protein FRB96_002649 [Tulasnella sp. 330]|nr:hypothetical protein FRB96_002649 [Tulasnella sp. 330]KAG8875478.1 hypothetical protein FRB97_005069 [Tulasnella sp. 331]KAG8882687.1 hypothetical protein FRB98_003516 [Tulasnella sp. 332]